MTIQSLYKISIEINYTFQGHGTNQELNISANDAEHAIKKLRKNNPFHPQKIEKIVSVVCLYHKIYV